MPVPDFASDTIQGVARRIEELVELIAGGGAVGLADDIAAIKTATETTASDGATENTLASLKAVIEVLEAAAATEATLADVLAGVGAPDDAEPGFGGDGSLIAQAKALLTALGTVASETTAGVIADRLSSSNVTVLESASRTADELSAEQVTSATGAYFYLAITVIAGTTLTPTLQAHDPVGGAWVDLQVFDAQTATGTYVYLVHPDAVIGTALLEGLAAIPLPRAWRIKMAHSDTTATEYSVGAHLLP